MIGFDWRKLMGTVREKMKSADKYGFVRSILVFVTVTVFVFLLLQKITYDKALDSCQEDMVNGAGMVTTQFNDMVTCNTKYATAIADVLSGHNLSDNQYVSQILKSLKKNCGFEDVFILYSSGTRINEDGSNEFTGTDMISSVFNNGDDNLSLIADNNNDEMALFHVPIVDGKSALVGVLEKNYFVKNFNMFSYGEINRVMIVSSSDGRILLNMNAQGVADYSSKENYYINIANQKYLKDFSYGQAKRDITKEQTGFTAYYSSTEKENQYIYFTAIGYSDWMLIQVLPESAVKETATTFSSATVISLLCLIFVYILILLFSIYLIRKSNKENEEIKMKIRVAELANEAKTNFLSNMSHDIRTPLNAIVGLSDICEMNADNPDRVRDCIEKQKAASDHLMTLINDVLEMSRIESGRVVFEDNEFNIGKQLHELVIMIQQRLSEKQLILNVTISELIHEIVIGDEQRLNRVMINILSNAVKFTGNGGVISISLNERPAEIEGYGEFEIVVSDTGLGMSPEFIKKIFVPFERMQDSTVSQIEGAGLGMAIAHDLIDKMGGNIDVQSKVGVGTQVTVTLNLKLVDEDREKIKYHEVIDQYAEQTVIVVDDDDSLVEWMDKMINSIGMQCYATTNAKDAIDKVTEMYNSSEKIAMMIFGWRMPGIDGIELTSIIREIVGNDIPIVIQTAYEFDNSDNDMRKVGINHVMIEPIFRSDILDMFEEMLNGGISSKMAFPDFTGKRILLVEDHKVNAEIVKEYLEYTGIIVDVVFDGTEAVERIKNTKDGYYNLILMDIRMPKMNGYDATRAIRGMSREYTKKIPIIALSANAFIEDKKMSKEVGMNGHLAKPVKYDEVYAELKKWFI